MPSWWPIPALPRPGPERWPSTRSPDAATCVRTVRSAGRSPVAGRAAGDAGSPAGRLHHRRRGIRLPRRGAGDRAPAGPAGGGRHPQQPDPGVRGARQSLLYGHVVPEVNDFCDVDYGQVARSFGVNGFRARNVAELREALAVALERRAPTVIDAVIDREAIAPVTRYDRGSGPRAVTIQPALRPEVVSPDHPTSAPSASSPSGARTGADGDRATSWARSTTSRPDDVVAAARLVRERSGLLAGHPARRARTTERRLRAVQPDPPDDPRRQRGGDRDRGARLLRGQRPVDPRDGRPAHPADPVRNAVGRPGPHRLRRAHLQRVRRHGGGQQGGHSQRHRQRAGPGDRQGRAPRPAPGPGPALARAGRARSTPRTSRRARSARE